ncbi:29336_t:CDS:1, partial [Gigaspora margarita]
NNYSYNLILKNEDIWEENINETNSNLTIADNLLDNNLNEE